MPSDRVAVVIGSSSGIGHALAFTLLEEGWQVVGISRSPSSIVHASYRHEVADVAGADYRSLLERALPPRIDTCVYCAGVGERFDGVGVAQDTATFAVNMLGAATTVELVVPRMISVGAGHFIGLSSLAAVAPSAEAPSYAASKAGLSSYLVGLSMALRSRGVHVSDVRFGFVDTKMAKSPTRPFMISPAQAARVVMRCMATRPVRLSYPWQMSVVMRLVSLIQAARRW
ncbi:MAG TPA: SDR family NAD(P)-dependent oxidoreductase [Polyangiaceae bacterium]|nr:SDR family NAD(P)-dependent oxidoreductase [Polyangiaceae bacterium]